MSVSKATGKSSSVKAIYLSAPIGVARVPCRPAAWIILYFDRGPKHHSAAMAKSGRALSALLLASYFASHPAVAGADDDASLDGSDGRSHQGPGGWNRRTSGGMMPPINIISPRHGSCLGPASEVDLTVVIRGFEMGPEQGCAAVYLNTHFQGKKCSSSFSLTLVNIREGTSAVDVVLLDENDRELPAYSSSTFTVAEETGNSDCFARWWRRGEHNKPMRTLLITYGSAAFEDLMTRLAVSALEFGGFDGVLKHRPSDIDASFAAEHSHILSQRRGRGLWLWKPYIINRTLSTLPDGQIVMYSDAQIQFVAPAHPLFMLADSEPQGVVSFGMSRYTDRQYTKSTLFSALGCEESQRQEPPPKQPAKSMVASCVSFLVSRTSPRPAPRGRFVSPAPPRCKDSGQRAATFMLFRNGAPAREFVREWLAASLQEQLIGDGAQDPDSDDADFIAHRHDQSIFSLLCKRMGLPAYRLPTQYGLEDGERGFPGEYAQILLSK